jgi:hypothetical protein
MRTIYRAITLAAIIVGVALPLVASAASTVVLRPGNMITASMNQTLDSGSAHNGDRFTLTVLSPYPNSGGSSFANAQLDGHVTNVVRAGQGRNAVLEFAIDRIHLANGQQGAVSTLLQTQATQRHNNTSNVALTAVGGMIVGNIIGKTLFHSNLGGPAGLVGGALYAYNMRTNVSMRKGSVLVSEVVQHVAVLR